MDGPTFICIGAQKAATRSVYDLVDSHQDSLMPPIKELHYFDGTISMDRRKKLRRREKLISRKVETSQEMAKRHEFMGLWRDQIRNEQTSVERYGEIWRPFEGLVTGDVTPAYAALPAEIVERISITYPDVKTFIVVRDPVARLWSQALRIQRQEYSPEIVDIDAPRFAEMCETNSILSRSFQSKAIETWQKHFGDRFKVFFFDDLVQTPDRFYANVCRFVGLDPDPSKFSLPFDYNRKSKPKQRIDDEMKNMAHAMMQDEISRLANMIGGHAEKWAAGSYNP